MKEQSSRRKMEKNGFKSQKMNMDKVLNYYRPVEQHYYRERAKG